jgi:hypothetical protein
MPAPAQQFVGAVGFHADGSGINEVGRVTHEPEGPPGVPIRRSFVVGDRLFTVSDSGIEASRLDNLAKVAFVGFPTG